MNIIRKLIITFDKLIILNISLCLIAGTVITDVLEQLAIGVCFMTCVLLLVMIIKKNKLMYTIAISILAFNIGILRVEQSKLLKLEARRMPLENITIEAKVRDIIDEDNFTYKLVLDHVEISGIANDNEYTVSYEGKLLTNRLKVGNIGVSDRIAATGTLTVPDNFEGFSYDKYLESRKILHTVIIDNETLEVKQKFTSIFRMSRSFKKYVSGLVSKNLSQPHADLLKGIVYGGDGSFSEDFNSALNQTGTTHIVAVSGYNITVLIALMHSIFSLFGRKLSSVLSLLFIVLFVLFVGLNNVPVVRAGIMGIVFSVSRLLGRKGAITTLLPAAAAALLLESPLVFRQISFQLSFFSTLGLVIACDYFVEKFEFIPKLFREDFASTISALVFTLPITIYNFGTMSLVAPLTNLIILPIVPIITIGGLIIMILLIIRIPVLTEVLVQCIWVCLELVIRVINMFANLDFASIELREPLSSIVTLLLVTFVLLLFKRKILPWRIL